MNMLIWAWWTFAAAVVRMSPEQIYPDTISGGARLRCSASNMLKTEWSRSAPRDGLRQGHVGLQRRKHRHGSGPQTTLWRCCSRCCLLASCLKTPVFNVVRSSTALYCKQHTHGGMVDVRSGSWFSHVRITPVRNDRASMSTAARRRCTVR